MTKKPLPLEAIAELDAIRKTTTEIGRPTMLAASLWNQHGWYRIIVRRGPQRGEPYTVVRIPELGAQPDADAPGLYLRFSTGMGRDEALAAIQKAGEDHG